MNSKRTHNRAEHALPIVWAAFACADVASEAMRRMVGAPAVDAGTRIGGTFIDVGRRILQRMRAMLSADAIYHQLRARQRRRQARRDAIARRLYRQLSQARPRLRRLVKDAEVRCQLEKLGPTRRRPWLLCRQASEILNLLQLRLRDDEISVVTEVIEEIAATLGASLAELNQALDRVGQGRYEVASAMLNQRQAMQRFDRTATRGAQLIEAQLNLIGLPTLGDSVRPQVGRRGRPLKQRPVDRHPDLVEQVRAVGMIQLDDHNLPSTAAPETTIDEAIGIEPSSSVENSGRASTLGVQESPNNRCSGLSEPSEGQNGGAFASEKIEHLFTELSQGLEKIEHDLTKPLAGLEKIETLRPEQENDGEIINHQLPKHEESDVSLIFTGIRVPPPVTSPGRRPYCRPSVAAGRPRGAASPRADAAKAPPSPLRRVRRVASSWWGKIRPAA